MGTGSSTQKISAEGADTNNGGVHIIELHSATATHGIFLIIFLLVTIIIVWKCAKSFNQRYTRRDLQQQGQIPMAQYPPSFVSDTPRLQLLDARDVLRNVRIRVEDNPSSGNSGDRRSQRWEEI